MCDGRSVAKSAHGNATRCPRAVKCEICFEDVSAPDAFVTATCLHSFHKACFGRWVQEYDASQLASAAAQQERDAAAATVHAAQEREKAALESLQDAQGLEAAAAARLASLQALQGELRSSPSAAAAWLEAQTTGLGAGAAAETVRAPIGPDLMTLCRPFATAPTAETRTRRGRSGASGRAELPELVAAAAEALRAQDAGATARSMLATLKNRLGSAKTAAAAATAATAKHTARHAAAHGALEAATLATAGAGQRDKDTPCAVCRTLVPASEVADWLEVQPTGTAAATAPAGTGAEEQVEWDACTAAYLAKIRQQHIQGLRRQHAVGGLLPEAEELLGDLLAG